MSDVKKKNKCDLNYNRYCQYFNTTIIILVTVFIGIVLVVLTEQIKISMNLPFVFVSSLFSTVLLFSVFFLINFHNKMKRIMKEIDKLRV